MTTTYSIQQRNKKKGIMTWYLRTCTNGRQTFESLHTTKKGEATAILNDIKLKAAMPDKPKTNNKPIEEMVTDWIKQIEVMYGVKSRTARAYLSRIQRWSNWCQQNNVRLHSEFGGSEAYRFVFSLTEKLAPKTISEIIKVAKACIEWNSDTFGLTNTLPFKSVKPPKQKKSRKEFWTGQEIDLILSNAKNDYYRAFWALMAYAGLRFAEARNLTTDNINNGIITVINGKGGKNAEIPMSSKLADIIQPMLSNEGLVIPRNEVSVKSDRAILHLRNAVKKSGIPGEVSHHKLRHSFASELLRKGTNPRTVQELMRHSSIDTLFNHYAHILRQDLIEAVEKI